MVRLVFLNGFANRALRLRSFALGSLAAFAFVTAATAGPPAAAPAAKQNLDNLVDPNAEPSAAAPAAVVVVDTKQMEVGRIAYKSYCERCHGINMASPGGGFFDLRTFPLNDKPRFVDSVTHGKRAMPAWGAVFKPNDIEALWAYVAGTQPSKAN